MKNKFILTLLVLFGLAFFTASTAGARDVIVGFDLIDRRADKVVADVHIDHWHGSLPVIAAGESLSLGAVITGRGNEEIELDGKRTVLDVKLAPDANEDIVSLQGHGDHVHITGKQAGESSVIFQVKKDGEVRYVAPSMDVRVGEGKAGKKKKGILLAAFGSSYPEARPAFENIEQMTKQAFPDIPVRWAYTSGMVRRALAEKGEHYDSVPMALARMAEDGFTHVAVQSLHTIAGVEFHQLRSVVDGFQNMDGVFTRVSLGSPLLGTPDEMRRIRDVLLENLPEERKPDEAVIWVGHGTYHPSNAFYQALAYKLRQKDENVFVATLGCLGGSPSFEDVKKEIVGKEIQKAYIAPFMSIVGAHTLKDVAGVKDHENSHDHDHSHSHDHNHDDHDHHHGESWADRLSHAGIEAQMVFKGTGEYDEIVQIWLDRLKEALEALE